MSPSSLINNFKRFRHWFLGGIIQHPKMLRFNTPEQATHAPMPLAPPYFDIRFGGMNRHFILRAPHGEGELSFWPEESDEEFERAINRTPRRLQAQGLFWFSQSHDEISLAVGEMILIRKLRSQTESVI